MCNFICINYKSRKAITPHTLRVKPFSIYGPHLFRPSEPKVGPSSPSSPMAERKGPRRWRQEGKYLFCGLSVELQTSVCLLRKLSPAREQPKQTIPHHTVWLAADPCVCLFVQTAAMTDGGTLGRKKSEERERQNKT